MIAPVQLQKLAQSTSNFINQGCNKIGSKVAKSSASFDKFINKVEPTGANNSFPGLVLLMVGMVICPRVVTAARRNPDNKEATSDEIKEILFRDIQTVLVVLFALKMMNTVIGRGASKVTGLPMTNKPYRSMFESKAKGLGGIKEKAAEFANNPIEKLKIMGRNILDTIHPTGGVKTYTNEGFINQYSGYNSIEEVNKMYSDIARNKGDIEKLHGIVMDDIISNQKAVIEAQEKAEHAGFNGSSDKAKRILEALETVKENGISSLKEKNLGLQDESISEDVKTLIVDFFKNPENKLVNKGKKLSAALRTIALGIESAYLGFGIPALNQLRLEKKYLSENGNQVNKKDTKKKINYKEERLSVKDSAFIKKALKPDEAQIFQKFLG